MRGRSWSLNRLVNKWSKEMEVSAQAKTVALAVGKELKLLQGENKARN